MKQYEEFKEHLNQLHRESEDDVDSGEEEPNARDSADDELVDLRRANDSEDNKEYIKKKRIQEDDITKLVVKNQVQVPLINSQEIYQNNDSFDENEIDNDES